MKWPQAALDNPQLRIRMDSSLLSAALFLPCCCRHCHAFDDITYVQFEQQERAQVQQQDETQERQ